MSKDTEEQEAPTLTLDTLVWAAKVIDAASKRGAFHANELSNVGRTYDELAAYVDFYRPKEAPKAVEESTEE